MSAPRAQMLSRTFTRRQHHVSKPELLIAAYLAESWIYDPYPTCLTVSAPAELAGRAGGVRRGGKGVFGNYTMVSRSDGRRVSYEQVREGGKEKRGREAAGAVPQYVMAFEDASQCWEVQQLSESQEVSLSPPNAPPPLLLFLPPLFQSPFLLVFSASSQTPLTPTRTPVHAYSLASLTHSLSPPTPPPHTSLHPCTRAHTRILLGLSQPDQKETAKRRPQPTYIIERTSHPGAQSVLNISTRFPPVCVFSPKP